MIFPLKSGVLPLSVRVIKNRKAKMSVQSGVFPSSQIDSTVCDITDQIERLQRLQNESLDKHVKHECDAIAEALWTIATKFAPHGIHAENHLSDFRKRCGPQAPPNEI